MECIYKRWFQRDKYDTPAYRCGYYLLSDHRIEQIKSLETGMQVLFNYRTSGGLYHGDLICMASGVIKEIKDQRVYIKTKAIKCIIDFDMYWLGQSFFLDKGKAEQVKESMEQQEYERLRIEKEGGTEH